MQLSPTTTQATEPTTKHRPPPDGKGHDEQPGEAKEPIIVDVNETSETASPKKRAVDADAGFMDRLSFGFLSDLIALGATRVLQVLLVGGGALNDRVVGYVR